MTPRPIPDPVDSAPLFVAFCLSTIAACFLAGYKLGALLYEKTFGGNDG